MAGYVDYVWRLAANRNEADAEGGEDEESTSTPKAKMVYEWVKYGNSEVVGK